MRPKHVFLSIDGPRPDRPGDAEKIEAVARLAERIDWPCGLKVRRHVDNFGPCRGVVSAIDWMFESFETGIVLEDDCHPEPTFFPYASELLDRYASDVRIGMISGVRPPKLTPTQNASYGFSRYSYIWGWATWRRAWNLMDPHLPDWEQIVREGLVHAALNDETADWWIRRISENRQPIPFNWDSQWSLTCWLHRMACVVPGTNLVTNVGADEASNMNPNDPAMFRRTAPMTFPLVHPKYLVLDVVADNQARYDQFSRRSFARRAAGRIKRELLGRFGASPGRV